MAKLTNEMTKGTRTIHLPLKRDKLTPPVATIVIQKIDTDFWHAGLSVVHSNDRFNKKTGRQIAFERMQGRPIYGTLIEVINYISEQLELCSNYKVISNSGYIHEVVFTDIVTIYEELSKS